MEPGLVCGRISCQPSTKVYETCFWARGDKGTSIRDYCKMCHDREFGGTTMRYNSEKRYIPRQRELRSAISPFLRRNQQVPLK